MAKVAGRARPITVVLLAAACAVAAWGWWRSRSDADALGIRSPAGHLQVLASHRGGLIAFVSELPLELEAGRRVQWTSTPVGEFDASEKFVFDGGDVRRSAAGFRLVSGKLSLFGASTPGYHALRVPYWAVLLAAGVPLLLACRTPLRRRRWGRQGRCPECGYDLRGTPGRCPECGAGAGCSTDPDAEAGAPAAPAPRRATRVALTSLAVIIALAAVGTLTLAVYRNTPAADANAGDGLGVYRADDLIGPPYWPDVPTVRVIHADPGGPDAGGNACFPAERAYPYEQDVRRERLEGVSDLAWQLPESFGPAVDLATFTCGDRIVLAAPAPVRHRYAQLLDCMRNPANPAFTTVLIADGPADREPAPRAPAASRDKLWEHVPELTFDGVTAEEAIARLGEETKVHIAVDWDVTDSYGFGRDARVKLRLWDAPLRSALQVLFTTVTDDATAIATYEENGVVHVTTRDALDRRTAELRIYDIRPLLVRYYASSQELTEAIHAATDRKAAGRAGPATRPSTEPRDERDEQWVTREETIEEITTLVKECVDPDHWRDNGGTTGYMREWGGRLLVTSTQANHDKIEATLKLLYDAAAPLGEALTRPTTFPAARRIPPPPARAPAPRERG